MRYSEKAETETISRTNEPRELSGINIMNMSSSKQAVYSQEISIASVTIRCVELSKSVDGRAQMVVVDKRKETRLV